MEVLEKFHNNIDLLSLIGITGENEEISDEEMDDDNDSIFSPLLPTRSEYLKVL